jgi:hypothetical protein
MEFISKVYRYTEWIQNEYMWNYVFYTFKAYRKIHEK